jgi:hypothetical protein
MGMGKRGIYMEKEKQVVFLAIKGSTIKRILILDFLTGSGIFYTLKILTSSVLLGMVGSFVCTESIKRVSHLLNK